MKTKNKRVPLSIIRLYKMAQRYTVENPRKNTPEIIQFLEYVNQHKNDTL